jgi:exopolyphosphatase/guanosine-5'-triphosphate,3'-diphosphate pyrophosphatase
MTDLPRKLQRVVRTLSAFLRLAESLDRSRHGVIKKVDVRERAGTVRVDVFGVGDSELEVWAATRQLPALEQALKRSAKIAAHHVEEEEPAKPKARRRRAASGRAA